MIERQGVRLVGLALAGLDDDAVQLGLPFGRHRAAGLDSALDEIRDGTDRLRSRGPPPLITDAA